MNRAAGGVVANTLRVLLLSAGLWVAGVSHAALFEDDEARKAILELRQKVEASRLSSDGVLQKLVDTQNELLRKSTEDTAQLRRALLDMQNQIEGLKGELARSNGQREQFSRELSDLQRELKDLAQRQQELARGVEERVAQLEPVKLTVDGREIMVAGAERGA